MLRIPLSKLIPRNLDELMRRRAISHIQHRLTQFIIANSRDNLHPEIVVDAAERNPIMPLVIADISTNSGYIHSQPDNDICPVPETDVPSVRTGAGRVPRQDNHVQVGNDGEGDGNVPGAEIGAGDLGVFATVSGYDQAECQEQIEDVCRVDTQVDDCFG